MMVKVLLYAYATGVFSSRALAKGRSEWDLVCPELNARHLHALMAA